MRVIENVRGRHVYIVQSTAFPANDNFMELLFWIDAFKRASAASVTAVMPYFSYAKGDKKDEPRVSIRARVCADAIEAAGADRVVTLDLHAPQIQGFFHVPVDDLYALPVLGDAVAASGLSDLVVVSPDAGFAKKARKYATRCAPRSPSPTRSASTTTRRPRSWRSSATWQGKTALIVDDFTISGGTLVEVAEKLVERGAAAVYAAITHGVFARGRWSGWTPARSARCSSPTRSKRSRSRCRRRCRWCRSPRSSARRSAASTTARASASCSRLTGAHGRHA